MAKADRVEKVLAEVASWRDRRTEPGANAALRGFLRDKSGLVVAKAAEMAAAWGERSAIPELISAFDRLVDAADAGCLGKTALAKLLCEWTVADAIRVFERGITIVQMEAAWGRSVDVAAELRGWCALGLSALGHGDQVRLILPLLADGEVHARIMGIRALAQGGSDPAEALLRLKALQGDSDETVTGECLSGLAQAWPERSAEFLEKLAENERTAQGRLALHALAESRSDRAWAALVRMFDATVAPTRRKDLLSAMATARTPVALAWMLDIIENGAVGTACDAIEAVKIRRNEPAVWAKVQTAAQESGNPRIEEAFRQVR